VPLSATLCVVGAIWFVQVVHYPLLAKVGSERFAPYSKRTRLDGLGHRPDDGLGDDDRFFLVFRRHEILPLAAILVGLALVALI
jgi:hypothetical protein